MRGRGKGGGGGKDAEVHVIVHRPLILPGEEEEGDGEDLNDVVEVGAGEEEALVRILNLPPIDSLLRHFSVCWEVTRRVRHASFWSRYPWFRKEKALKPKHNIYFLAL